MLSLSKTDEILNEWALYKSEDGADNSRNITRTRKIFGFLHGCANVAQDSHLFTMTDRKVFCVGFGYSPSNNRYLKLVLGRLSDNPPNRKRASGSKTDCYAHSARSYVQLTGLKVQLQGASEERNACSLERGDVTTVHLYSTKYLKALREDLVKGRCRMKVPS